MMNSKAIEDLVARESSYFPSVAMWGAFESLRVLPRSIELPWRYSPAVHAVWIVAVAIPEGLEFVYCATGFGPSFPWWARRAEDSHLGCDAGWCAYLFEVFAISTAWPAGPPEGFFLAGPGERDVQG